MLGFLELGINRIWKYIRKFIRKPSTRRALKFVKRYSAQLSFAILVTMFLTVTVGEGQAYDVQTPKLAAQLSTNSNGFFGKPQVLGDQTVSTGEVQQQVAIVYQVTQGDSITSIADRYSLSVGTILDANSISATNAKNIKPGQTLLIPAVDTNTSLAWLSAINTQQQQEQAAAAAAAAKASATAKKSNAKISSTPAGTVINGVIYIGTQWGAYNGGVPGQCTWYVNSVRHFPGPMGNGGQYLSSARAYGYATGSVPRVGAVIVTAESWYGHVGIVVGVSGSNVTIKEMNYLGAGKIDERSIDANSGYIKGYIY